MQLVLKIFFPSCTKLKSAATDGAKTIFKINFIQNQNCPRQLFDDGSSFDTGCFE